MKLFPRSLCNLQQSLERSLAVPIWELALQQSQPGQRAHAARRSCNHGSGRRSTASHSGEAAPCALSPQLGQAMSEGIVVLAGVGPCYGLDGQAMLQGIVVVAGLLTIGPCHGLDGQAMLQGIVVLAGHQTIG